MISEQILFHGTVRNGVIIPDKGFALPDGAIVEIKLTDESADLPDSYNAELAAWDQAGANAWAMIEDWERDDAPPRSES